MCIRKVFDGSDAAQPSTWRVCVCLVAGFSLSHLVARAVPAVPFLRVGDVAAGP